MSGKYFVMEIFPQSIIKFCHFILCAEIRVDTNYIELALIQLRNVTILIYKRLISAISFTLSLFILNNFRFFFCCFFVCVCVFCFCYCFLFCSCVSLNNLRFVNHSVFRDRTIKCRYGFSQ